MEQYVNGGWQEQVIYSFQAVNDLHVPTANLVVDAKGNLYGCAQGGTHGQVGIFRLTPPAQTGPWQETVLYNFGDRHNDPVAASTATQVTNQSGCGITMDPSTGLIVGTSAGGGNRGLGTIFTLTPPAAGQTAWTEAVGHSFSNNGGGQYPDQPPLRVGGTYYGGTGFSNEIYAFTP